MSRSLSFGRSQAMRENRGANDGRASRRLRFEAFEDRRMLSFAPAVNHATIGTPSLLATADFNNDGYLDLATGALASIGSVSVLLGDGVGGFGAAQRTVAGSSVYSMAVLDYDGDNNLDIVAPDPGSGAVRLLAGKGDGAFQPVATLWEPNGGRYWAYDVAAGDFDNNGHDDLLVTLSNVQEYDLVVQVGLGDRPRQYVSGSGVPADLNNDGKLDVVTSFGSVLLGNGDGTLQSEAYYPAETGGALATGDFTGEGNADVIVAGNVAVLRGNGDGGFAAPIPHTADGTTHTGVATADFNADGKLDAVVTSSDTGTVSVLLGNGDGTLSYFGAFATGSSPSGVVVSDFNGDGRPDVAVSNAGSTSRNVSVLLNDGEWETVPPAPPTLSISDTTVTEGDGGTLNATFTVTLTRPAAVDVTVRYDTANITATAATDYTAASGVLIIPAGQTSRAFTVPIKGDRIAESTETFAVNLSNPTNASIADGQAIGTILDNEPRVTINDVIMAEGSIRTPKDFTFTVSLSAAYNQDVTVSFTTANGTAKASSDYQSKTGSVTFSPGETSKTITVAVIGDKQKEANETFFVNLSGAPNAEITDSQGLGTILNDDGASAINGKGFQPISTLALDAAIEDWMFAGRKKRDARTSVRDGGSG